MQQLFFQWLYEFMTEREVSTQLIQQEELLDDE